MGQVDLCFLPRYAHLALFTCNNSSVCKITLLYGNEALLGMRPTSFNFTFIALLAVVTHIPGQYYLCVIRVKFVPEKPPFELTCDVMRKCNNIIRVLRRENLTLLNANNKGAAQPGCLHNLISTFNIRFQESIRAELAIRKISIL